MSKTLKAPAPLNSGDGKTFIRVHSGRIFRYDDIPNNDISLHDIAVHLSRESRWSGATRTYYSVAQHSVIVSAVVERTEGALGAMYGLLHDAHEAFMKDQPTPLKQYLFEVTGYDLNDLADKIDEAIFARFGLDFPIPDEIERAVKYADFDVCMAEGRQLVKNFRTQKFNNTEERPDVGVTFQPMLPDAAERYFLERFNYLRGKLGSRVRV